MSNSTTLLDTISSTQANKEVVVNALLDAASPGMLWGRHASATSGLTWGYYGGQYGANAIANGTVTLTASVTNYVYADNTTGTVSVNTTGVPSGKIPLYSIVAGTTTVTSYTDIRSYAPMSQAGASFGNQTANYIFAGPTNGSAAAPAFRLLVAADLPVMVASGSSHAPGAVPDPGATAGTTHYLREDGTWQVPPGSGGASTLSGLSDVNVTEGAGIDGFSLTWNNATSKWVATSASAGTYAALTDVALASLANNQVPAYSSSAAKWKNQTLALGPLVLDAWNVSDMSTHGALSGGNLICTMASAPSSFSLVRGAVSHTSGKWVFEISVSTVASLFGGGIATSADGVDAGAIPGQSDGSGSVLRGDGFATAASGTHANISAAANTPYMIAVDITNGLIWYRISNGNWNNSGTANPATGTGGLAITSALTYFPVCVFSASGQAGTLNVGATSFANTAPSGFSAWNANDTPGLQPSDANIAAPAKGQVLTYDGSKWINAAKQRVSSVAYASTVTLDCSTADVFEITLTGNITINFSNAVDGQKVTVTLTQDGTGSRTVTWGTGTGFGSDITTAVASTAASKIDYFELRYNAAAAKYHMVSVARGY